MEISFVWRSKLPWKGTPQDLNNYRTKWKKKKIKFTDFLKMKCISRDKPHLKFPPWTFKLKNQHLLIFQTFRVYWCMWKAGKFKFATTVTQKCNLIAFLSQVVILSWSCINIFHTLLPIEILQKMIQNQFRVKSEWKKIAQNKQNWQHCKCK